MGQLKLQRTTLVTSNTVLVETQLATEPSAVSLPWVPDTGSDVDAIGVDHLTHLGGHPENLADDFDDVMTADGRTLSALGQIQCTLSVGEVSHTTSLHVYGGLSDALLSRRSLEALGFLPEGWPQVASLSRSPNEQPSSEHIHQVHDDLLSEFADVFSDDQLRPMSGDAMHIQLQPDAKPFCITTTRPVPYAYREQVKAQLDDMVAAQIIQPVSEPTEWCHPIVIVPKKGTSEIRLTVNLSKLNKQVSRPVHPMRSPRDTVANLNQSRYFTKLDARIGTQ